jgi:hypothetical protein
MAASAGASAGVSCSQQSKYVTTYRAVMATGCAISTPACPAASGCNWRFDIYASGGLAKGPSGTMNVLAVALGAGTPYSFSCARAISANAASYCHGTGYVRVPRGLVAAAVCSARANPLVADGYVGVSCSLKRV